MDKGFNGYTINGIGKTYTINGIEYDLELKSTEEMTTEDWEELLNQHNTYSWCVYVIYSIVWLPLSDNVDNHRV